MNHGESGIQTWVIFSMCEFPYSEECMPSPRRGLGQSWLKKSPLYFYEKIKQ